MGRGTRSSAGNGTAPVGALRVQVAAERKHLGWWQDEPLPGRWAMGSADADAPRDGVSSLAKVNRSEPTNEDRVWASQAAGVALLFDGMGGSKSGERASEAASGAGAMNLAALPGVDEIDQREAWIGDTLAFAHAVVQEDRLLNPHFVKQGATAVAAVLARSAEGRQVALVASIGDSRAYRFTAAGDLQRLTTDDDGLDTMIRDEAELAEARRLIEQAQGADDFEAASLTVQRAYQTRNSISHALGTRATQVERHSVEAGDLIIVCSDGVHDNLTRSEIGAIIRSGSGRTPQEVSDALTAAARERSLDRGHLRSKDDDISCAVLTV